MGKKTILIVPPRGVPIKSVRIRFSLAVVFFIFVISGFVGYFIPFNKITLSDIEKTQKKNLTEQNNALLQKILSSLRLLNNLKEQVDRLEVKKANISKPVLAENVSQRAKRKLIDVDKVEAGALVQYVQSQENCIKSFLTETNESNNLFDFLPVIAPVTEPYVISRVFGASTDPFTGTEKGHYGLDFVAEMESYIFATADGVIASTEDHPVWGKRIIIDHDNGISTVYAHLNIVKVSRGKRVSRGEVIGAVGASGLSTGPHLHYEIRIDDNPVDPYSYIYPALAERFAINLQ